MTNPVSSASYNLAQSQQVGKRFRVQSGSNQPRFQGVLVDQAYPLAQWVVRNLYDRGEGFRYAVEQTIGYTIPRTVQQWNRTRHVTGKSNRLAALEMLLRDLAADFADTFLPGLLATFGIGWGLDKWHKTLVQRNMGQDALRFYQSLMKTPQGQWVTKSQFFEQLEQQLKAYAKEVTKAEPKVALGLEQQLKQLKLLPGLWNNHRNERRIVQAAQDLTRKLGLTHFDVTLSHQSNGVKRRLEISLSHLLRDLWHMAHKNGKLALTRPWGEHMSLLLAKTGRLSRFQMIGNLVALAASISIPFAIRLITRKFYGKDAFPGTKELEDHFKARKKKHKSRKSDQQEFVAFPYLKKTLQAGNWMPTVITAAFFGVLAGAVVRSFRLNNASLLKLKDWFKVYAFKREFPYTTVTQMELTYGLLCGIRLAASRDHAEFRETAIRDCLLGWPTLTYFYDKFSRFLGRCFNARLARQYGILHMLTKPNGEVRVGDEINMQLFGRMGLGTRLQQAVQDVAKHQTWIKFSSALISWFLLAFAEPKASIWLTNHLELGRLKKERMLGTPTAEPIAQPAMTGAMAIPALPQPASPLMQHPRLGVAPWSSMYMPARPLPMYAPRAAR